METIEIDVVLMSLVIFVPALFALGLLFFPRGRDEAMRWWALFGTALTLGVSLSVFAMYYQQVAERHSANAAESTLVYRDAERTTGHEHVSDDWMFRYEWVPQFNIHYAGGLDGISMALVLLTTLLSFLAMIASWRIDRYVRGYLILFLLLETGMLGTFVALDFFLFFIFWEVMLLPMYFLIGVWGGPRREYAAIKFFLYTMLGSVFILIALLAFYVTDVRDFDPAWDYNKAKNTFNIVELQRVGGAAAELLNGRTTPETLADRLLRKQEESLLSVGERERLKGGDAALKEVVDKRVTDRLPAAVERLRQPFFSAAFQYTMFILLFIGFAVKVPTVPFHTWLPDAHVEAPTPISMILAGVLLKMGGYGIIRIAYPICPWAAEQLWWYVALVGIVSIVYGAFAAMAQTDFKKLVAYSSISHMGYVILGIAVWSSGDRSQYWEWGMNGAMFQMIAHGISSAGMFFLVGVVYDRAHHRNLDNFRGLYEPMPLYGGISAVIFFAAMGLPGLCGFPGEFFVVLAAWNKSPLFSVLAALTVVITAAYILWTLQRVFLGVNPAYKSLPDIDLRELACAVPLVILAVVLGVWPSLVLSWMTPSVNSLVESLAQLGP